jgi:hypothetical protein
MLKRMWPRLPCRYMYVRSCQTRPWTTSDGLKPNTLTKSEATNPARKSATLIAISALRAEDSGPGPNE